MGANRKSQIANRKSFDVLIVGAGPAGSLAAELLAHAGKSVALFDGRPTNEPKPCGGGVTSKALKAYPQLLEAVGRQIDDLELYAPSGRRLKLKLDEPFAIYSRSIFDGFLRDRAEAAGARIVRQKVILDADKTENEWTLRGYGKAADDTLWRGEFLVAADGANSAIAKRLSGTLANSEMEVAFGYRAPLPESGDAPTTVAFLPEFAGYAWAFPRPDHISFGIATAQDAFDHEKLDALLWRFMLGYYRQRENEHEKIWQNLEVVKNIELRDKVLKNAVRYAARIPGLAPETLDARKTCGEDWALLGDAAGFADPVTGEGIYYALRSAELFAESLLAGKPASYETRWRADFGAELRRASEMRRRFYGSFLGAAFTERMIQFAGFHTGIQKTLGELVAGDQGYTNLKQTLFRRAFLPF